MIDLEKAEKLPAGRRYCNISVFWIFYYRFLLRILYNLRIPHEAVTGLSLASGFVSAWLFLKGSFIAAAAARHFKDLFDACDGSLARITGKGHLIGRYMDSLGDFVVLTVVYLAIAARATVVPESGVALKAAGGSAPAMETSSGAWWIWAAAAILSTFLQCSVFNYYQLAYLDRFGIQTLSSRRDESARKDLELPWKGAWAAGLLALLRFLYRIVYGWQDRLVAALDSAMLRRWGKPAAAGGADDRSIASGGVEGRPAATGGADDRSIASGGADEWYGHKPLLVLQSALCFGTHIFIVIVCAVLGRPESALIFIAVFMNLYLVGVLLYRILHFAMRRGRDSLTREPLAPGNGRSGR